MAVGGYVLWVACAAVIVSVAAYLLSWRTGADETSHAKADRYMRIGRGAYLFLTATVLLTVILLMRAVVGHDFRIAYVTNYSSRELPLFYLVSCFWAGQEGTFLLWCFYSCILGTILILKSGAYERYVLPFLALVPCYLLTMLAVLNPFRLLPQTPPDGVGLNPLLQNPWMVIHPPVMFLGFASLGVPFAYSMAALVQRDYEAWTRRVLPWTLWGWCALGSAVCMGGYWAYVVLGWGGYWGWDPVENASFVPWVATTASLHALVAQRNRKVMYRSNFVLPLVAFLLVMYGSFLTRSGVLSDFSVHSFVNLGLGGYLFFFLVLFGLIGTAMIVWRWREIPAPQVFESMFTREFFFSLGVTTLLTVTIIVWLGMSSPVLTGIITEIVGKGSAAAVNTQFYADTITPLGILIAILIGVAPLVQWKKTNADRFWLGLLFPIAAMCVATLLVRFTAGIHDPVILIFGAASVFALTSNLQAILLTKRLLRASGYIAHVGIALMFIGIITSSFLDESKTVTLDAGVKTPAFGYQLIYHPGPRAGSPKPHFIDVEVVRPNGSTAMVRPRIQWSEYNKAELKNPGILRDPSHDLYLSPVEETSGQDVNQIVLGKGESHDYGGWNITFVRFETDADMHTGMKHIRVAALLKMQHGNASYELRPAVALSGDAQTDLPAHIPGTDAAVKISGVDAESYRVELALTGKLPEAQAPKEAAVIQVTRKPFINILWLGTFIAVSGVLLSVFRRAADTPQDR